MKAAKVKKRPGVIRRAFTLRLKPGASKKYIEYHDKIWPELVREIESSGIAQISTFADGLQLFLYSEIYDPKGWDKLWNSKIHDEWAECMRPLMQFRPDGKVDAGPLSQIFHLETAAAKPAGKSTGKSNSRASTRKSK